MSQSGKEEKGGGKEKGRKEKRGKGEITLIYWVLQINICRGLEALVNVTFNYLQLSRNKLIKRKPTKTFAYRCSRIPFFRLWKNNDSNVILFGSKSPNFKFFVVSRFDLCECIRRVGAYFKMSWFHYWPISFLNTNRSVFLNVFLVIDIIALLEFVWKSFWFQH